MVRATSDKYISMSIECTTKNLMAQRTTTWGWTIVLSCKNSRVLVTSFYKWTTSSIMSLNKNLTNQQQDSEALEHIFVHLSWKTWHPKSYMFHHQKTCKARVKAINYSREQVMRSLHCSFQGTSACFSNSKSGNFAWIEKDKTKSKINFIILHASKSKSKGKPTTAWLLK